MNELGQQDIIQQLIDNTTDIISFSTNGESERLAALAHRQKRLKQVLEESISHLGLDISRTSVDALQDLLAKAVDVVRTEMDRNRGNMRATGIKKKVLSAYGTVTLSNSPSK